VVEDHAPTRLLYRYLLGSRYDLTLTATLREADAAVDAALERHPGSLPFDLFLLDISLSGERIGGVVLDTLRRKPGCAHIPAVAVTAHALPRDARDVRQQGFDGYLRKPFVRAELQHAITTALPRPSE
jgi:CheY-like chemotaxis protein